MTQDNSEIPDKIATRSKAKSELVVSDSGLTSSVSSQSDAPITKAAVKDDEDKESPDAEPP